MIHLAVAAALTVTIAALGFLDSGTTVTVA